MDREIEHHDEIANESETSIMAIGSMVAGILGLSLLPAFGSLIALGLGYAARGELRTSEGLRGRRLATVGIVLGWIGVSLAIVGICMAFLAILLDLTAIPGITICSSLGAGL